jgi:hypothetical protein
MEHIKKSKAVLSVVDQIAEDLKYGDKKIRLDKNNA